MLDIIKKKLEWFNFVEPDKYFQTPGEALSFFFQYHGQHRSGWDYETLAMNLKLAGFSKVERTDYRKGPIKELNLEQDSEVLAIHSLCVNALK